jgi:CBS domain-containing protein
MRYTAKDLLKTKKIISFSPDDSLSKAMASLKSSHDVAFVLDDKDFLLGVVNPYYVQFQGNYPPSTKLKRCMMMPPKLSIDTKIEGILKNMLDSKMYFLPVLGSKGELLGIVSLRRVFKNILMNEKFTNDLETFLYPRSIQTINRETLLSQARSILKKRKISRLPVIDDQGKIIGLLTRFDIREALSDPKSSPGFSKSGKKDKSLNVSIEGFMNKRVFTQSIDDSFKDSVLAMIDKSLGSVVLVDKDNKPVGIVTLRDVIKAFLRILKSGGYSLHISTPKDFRYKKELEQNLRKKLSTYLKKIHLEAVDVRLISGKYDDMSDKWFEVAIRIESNKDFYTSQQRARGWRKAVSLSLQKLSAQIK